jgi:hypothetical protein
MRYVTGRSLLLTLAPPLAAALALACSDGPKVTDPAGGAGLLLARSAQEVRLARVSGQYSFDLEGGSEHHTFQAVARGNPTPPIVAPTFDGNYVVQVVFPDDPTRYGALAGQRHQIHGSVTCFQFVPGDPTTVRVGGTIERTTLPPSVAPPGSTAIWTVRDNGNGPKDPPDESSGVYVQPPGGDLAHCNGAGPTLPPFPPLKHGNIRVEILSAASTPPSP